MLLTGEGFSKVFYIDSSTFLKKNISRSDFWQFQKQIPNDFISFQLQLKDTLCVLSFVIKKKIHSH